MFDIDRWIEIFETIRKNKLRTFLTGLSVASGIFILVILLGFGQGMENGVRKEFEGDASNRIWVWTRVTTKEYKGLNPGRYIQMDNDDYEAIGATYEDELDKKSNLFRVFSASMNYGDESISYRIEGVTQDYQQIEAQTMVEGRYINQNDVAERTKVIVIGNKVKREVFKNESPIDKYIEISGISFKVVGVYKDPGGDREEERVVIPVTTAQKIFNGGNRLNNITFTLKPAKTFDESVANANKFANNVETFLKQSHTVAPDDVSAVNVYNSMEDAKRYFSLTNNIKLFFWFVGICTIIAGVVGVSNIMLIIVKDRTKEIGIRKAIGAKPWSIVGMILQEAIFVTAVFGFAGLILGMGLLELVGPNVEIDYVVNPSVNFDMAITMVIVLIIAGAVAGFIPAWKAAHIQPVKALSHE